MSGKHFTFLKASLIAASAMIASTAHGALILVEGQGQILRPGVSLVANTTENDDIRFLREVDQLALPSDLLVDIFASPNLVLNNPNDAGYPNPVPVIPAGTVVNSHFLHFDPVGAPNPAVSATATFTFDSQILGVIISNQAIPGSATGLLLLSDPVLGFGTTTYGTGNGRRTLRTSEATDLITLSDDGKSITVTMFVGQNNLDHMRIITASNGLPVPTLEYNAAIVGAGGANINDSVRKIVPTIDLANTGVTKTTSVGPTGYQNLFATFQLNGTDSLRVGATSLEDLVPGNPTNNNASFEILFRPDDLVGQEIVYEIGGTTNGISLTLNGSTLQLLARNNPVQALITQDITAVADDFIHAVAVVDLDSDLMSLYINGQLVLTEAFNGDAVDWAGANGDGIGSLGGTQVAGSGGLLGDLSAYGTLQGDIAIFRFYEQALNAGQVQDIFVSIHGVTVPEPASLSLLLLAGGMIARRRQRTS
ncbi:MAG: LamG-like jellyroll fold domain-containing protein [Phycisphaeraceae bacterium]